MTFDYGTRAVTGIITNFIIPKVTNLEISLVANKIEITYITAGGSPQNIEEDFDKVTHLALNKH